MNWGALAIHLFSSLHRAPNVMSYSVGGTGDPMSTTNTALAEAGQIAHYHQSVNAYRCPADVFLSRAQKAAGWQHRVRSISMNSNWGRSAPSDPPSGNP